MNDISSDFNILLENPSNLAQDTAVPSAPTAIKMEVKPCQKRVVGWHLIHGCHSAIYQNDTKVKLQCAQLLCLFRLQPISIYATCTVILTIDK